MHLLPRTMDEPPRLLGVSQHHPLEPTVLQTTLSNRILTNSTRFPCQKARFVLHHHALDPAILEAIYAHPQYPATDLQEHKYCCKCER